MPIPTPRFLARKVWGSISSTAVPSNAASAVWFSSASQSITGTKRDPSRPAKSKYYPPGLEPCLAPRVSRLSPPPSPGEGSERRAVPGQRLSGISARAEVTSAASEDSCFHEYTCPRGKAISRAWLSGEAQAHGFWESLRQCAPSTPLLLCIPVKKSERGEKKKLTEGLGVIEADIPPLPQGWSS